MKRAKLPKLPKPAKPAKLVHARATPFVLVARHAALVASLGALLFALTTSGAIAKPPEVAPVANPDARSGALQAGGHANQHDGASSALGPVKATAGLRGGFTESATDGWVPLKFMPPGTHASAVPSDEIFPPQAITIRFNHKKHVKELGQTCVSCHARAKTSRTVRDRLLPDPAATCDRCHGSNHQNLASVTAGAGELGQCATCHLGDDAGRDGKVAAFVLPVANLKFSHEKHALRNIACGHCHGNVAEVELATRSQLPRMAGCLKCHNMPDGSRGDAKSACSTCHLTERTGQLKTAFANGQLLPPRWMHQAAHTPDWLKRHAKVAATDSAFCGNCHADRYCTSCHDGKVRPRDVHPGDFLSMHAQAARNDNPRCTSCHQLQTFCADCHRRTGVAEDGPSGARRAGRRFHPPSREFTQAPRGARHHAWEAQRNLNQCVSCHTERDCTSCHATKGVAGGAGVNPHPLGFVNRCASALDRNPRPCLVCHEARDSLLRRCR